MTAPSEPFQISIPGRWTRLLTALLAVGGILGSLRAADSVDASHPDSNAGSQEALQAEVPPSSEAIPWSEVGTRAAEQYEGDGLSVSKTDEGALLNCVFQKLEGEATPQGLWLRSTVEGAGDERFRVAASGIGREDSLQTLDETGTVDLAGDLVQWQRPRLVEEYSVSVDGLRQDFVIAKRPEGEGELLVELDVTGAQAEATGHGARLVVDGSGRKIAYSRLRVVDAEGRELAARIEVRAAARMVVHVDDQEAAYPVRVDPTFSDENWISLNPGIPGANSTVNAAVSDSLGNLYIGGSFTVVGNIVANRIAKWNGTQWSALGDGVDGGVRALIVDGNDLYAGGDFIRAGGTVVGRIARWDGAQWHALGSGMNSTVLALATSSTDLYAAGGFTTAGGSAANRIAKWDGTQWFALGDGTDNTVWALAVSGNDLYAGGVFTSAGRTAANHIARWDGNQWFELGEGIDNWVMALAVSNGALYVGGQFTTAGQASANNIAKWDGTQWSALGIGMNSAVRTITVLDGDLYAGGIFTIAGGAPADRIAKWDGARWAAVGDGLNNSPLTLVVSNGDLYAGGFFTNAGASAAARIAKWDGNGWSALGSGTGLNSGVRALAVAGDDLYTGGTFTSVDGITANRVARWDGSQWSALGDGMNNEVWALVVSGGDLYAGGQFTMAGGVSAKFIAKWDGSSWAPLGTGMSAQVAALAVSEGSIYAGGVFSTAGGVAANRIAKWNGNEWSALGDGVNNAVQALAVSGSDLYAGGNFTTAGGSPANRIARWDGTQWAAMGDGMNGPVRALAVAGADLYAAGGFTTAGGIAANYIAKWDGSQWTALGSGLSHDVWALAVTNTDVFAAGGFTTAGAIAASRIAKWSGSTWSALGSGTDGLVGGMVVSGDDLFVGGDFGTAGGKVSPFIAKAILPANTPPVAVAGDDAEVECASHVGTDVTLDGSASYDPDAGDVLAFSWDVGGTVVEGVSPTVTLGMGVHVITLTVTDNHGVQSSDEVVIEIVDTTPPVITCPGDFARTALPGRCGGLATYTVTAEDACSEVVLVQTEGLPSGSEFPFGHTVNTFVAVDASGNQSECSFIVTVVDTQAPTIAGPGDLVVENDPGVCGAVVEFEVTANDNCSAVLTQVGGLPSGSVFPIGTTTNIFHAKDTLFTTEYRFTVSVLDLERPAITRIGTPNVSIECGSGVAYEELGATAFDACDGVVPVVISGDVVDVNTPGVYQINYDAADSAGNAAPQVRRFVYVEDRFPPSLLLPNEIIRTAGPGICGAVVTYDVTAIDGCCDVTPVLTAGLPSGSVFPVGETVVSYSATDASGNEAQGSFSVIVVDTEAPVIHFLPEDIVVENDPGVCGAVVTFLNPISTDNCSGPSLTFRQTEGLTTGSVFPVGTTTNTFVATDGAGNTTTASFTVSVLDIQWPTMTHNGSPNVLIYVGSGGYEELGATAIDLCDGELDVLIGGDVVDTDTLGVYRVTYDAVDAAGNAAPQLRRFVYVVDTARPAITAISPNSVVTGSGDLPVTLHGSGFLPGGTVYWGATTIPYDSVSATEVNLTVPAALLTTTRDVETAPVRFRGYNSLGSNTVGFTVTSVPAGDVDSEVMTGDEATVSTAPTEEGAAGLTVTLSRPEGSTSPVTVTAANFTEQPAGGVFDFADDGTGESSSSFVDLQIDGASSDDVAAVKFYYPSTVTGAVEEQIDLLFYDENSGTWTPVVSEPIPPSLTTEPIKDPADHQDGTVSGGSFTVVFGDSSVPAITELTGTIFVIGLVNPVVTTVDGPVEPVAVGTSTSWEAAFSARGPEENQTIRFSWGDGSETTVAPTEPGIAHAEHTYGAAGVYTVEVEVTDGQGVASRTFGFRYAVVYDPDGGTGFVTGGGWIHSPPGAFHPGLAEMAGIEGRASFGFVSRYKKGASVPAGSTEFQFRAGNLDFASTEYQWLVVAGKRAQYKGWGRINGSPELYGFMLTCIDGNQATSGDEPDRFRIKIWEEESETIIYDNQHGDTDNAELTDTTILGGGSIVIHKEVAGGKGK